MASKAQALPRENTNRRAVYDYLFKNPGKTSTEVSEALNLSHGEVSGPLSQLYAEGKLERQKVPNSFGKHAYFIPDRERPRLPGAGTVPAKDLRSDSPESLRMRTDRKRDRSQKDRKEIGATCC